MRRISLALVLSLIGTPLFASQGGESGGGGNVAFADQVTRSQIKAILTDIQRPTAAFYKFLSIASYSDRYFGIYPTQFQSIGSRLFSGAHEDAIINKLLTVKPAVLEQGDCFAPDGDHRDGSAATLPDRVCFSLDRIMARRDLHSNNVHTILVALAAHEYSHLLGANEAEAQFIQNIAIKAFADEAFDFFIREYSAGSTPILLGSVTNELISLVHAHADLASVCSALGSTVSIFDLQINDLFNAGFSGVSYFSHYEFSRIEPTLLKSENYLTFCKDDNQTSLWRQRIFGDSERISLCAYVAATQSQVRLSSCAKMVNLIGYGDYAGLDVELQDFSAAVEILNSAWMNTESYDGKSEEI